MSCPGNYLVHRPGDQFLPADQDPEHERGKSLGQHLCGGHALFAVPLWPAPFPDWGD